MDSISNNQNIINLNNINSPQTISKPTQTTGAEGPHKAHHHHHHKSDTQDSVDISPQGMDALNNSTQEGNKNSAMSPLNSLVADGTITQDQKNAIQSAFQAARESRLSGAGTYSNKPSNPIENLVSSGTITETQRKAIQSAFEAARHERMSSETGQDSTITSAQAAAKIGE